MKLLSTCFLLLFPWIAEARDLDGAWIQSCQNSYQRIVEFQSEFVSLIESNFEQKSCIQKNIETISEGYFAIGSRLEIPEDVFEMNFYFTRVAMVIHDGAIAASFKRQKMCGLEEWAAGREIEITGRLCHFFGPNLPIQVPNRSDGRFGIFRLVEDNLQFGRLSLIFDASTPEKRPKELDPVPYLRIAP